MANEVAGEGQVFVCNACGKRSQDRYGEQAIDQGWDASCMMHAVRCDESSLVIEDGRVTEATPVRLNPEPETDTKKGFEFL